jgi:hypothetical protein
MLLLLMKPHEMVDLSPMGQLSTHETIVDEFMNMYQQKSILLQHLWNVKSC